MFPPCSRTCSRLAPAPACAEGRCIVTEPTIICPNCNSEIKLTESLAAPLIESTRKQFEQQLAQKDSDIAKREQLMREKEKQFAEEKCKLEVRGTPR